MSFTPIRERTSNEDARGGVFGLVENDSNVTANNRWFVSQPPTLRAVGVGRDLTEASAVDSFEELPNLKDLKSTF